MESRAAYSRFISMSMAASLFAAGAFSPISAADKPNYANKMQLGQLLYFNGNVDHAIRAFKTAAALKPDSFEPHLNLVNIYVQKQDLDSAVAECREGLKIKPTHRDLHLILGNLLRTMAGSKEAGSEEQKKMIDEAVTELKTAGELGADGALVDSTLSVIHVQQGNFDKAMEHVEKAINKKDKLPDAHLIKGVLHFKKSQGGKTPEEIQMHKDLAMKHLDKAIEQKGKNAEARNTKADILFSGGKVDEALEEYNRALKDDERYHQARMGISNILISRQKWEEALEHLLKAQETKPDDANILYSIGICLEKMGKQDQAVIKFNEGVMVDPNPQSKAQIMQHIRELQQHSFLNVPSIFGSSGTPVGPGAGLFGPGSNNLFGGEMKDLIKIKPPPGESEKK